MKKLMDYPRATWVKNRILNHTDPIPDDYYVQVPAPVAEAADAVLQAANNLPIGVHSDSYEQEHYDAENALDAALAAYEELTR